jgi:hypothetical protein
MIRKKSEHAAPYGAYDSIGPGNYKYAAPLELPNNRDVSKSNGCHDVRGKHWAFYQGYGESYS